MMTTNVTNLDLRRGDIVIVDFGKQIGSEQSGKRPALIIQNDKGNKFSPTVIICGITSQNKKKIPTHVEVCPEETGLKYHSVILFEQVRTIDKSRVYDVIGHVSENLLEKCNKSIAISFGLCYNN